MKILKQAELITVTTYSRCFDWSDKEPNYGYAFDCDKYGNLLRPSLSFEKCLTGSVDGTPILDKGVRKHEHTYREPAIGQCNACRRPVVLEGFTNTCVCSLDYNSAGQQLAPREQWGEETGETASDILLGGDAWGEH